MLTISLVIGLMAALAGLAIAAYSLPAGSQRSTKTESAQSYTSTNAFQRWGAWPHEAPKTPFTPAQAHEVMRSHRACRRGDCARKDAAWMVLVDAGRVRPAMPRIGGVR